MTHDNGNGARPDSNPPLREDVEEQPSIALLELSSVRRVSKQCVHY